MFGNWHAVYVLGEMYRNHPVTSTEVVPSGTIFITMLFCLVCCVFMVWIMNEESKALSNKEGD